ncbi:MAG: hypothetical protein AAB225_19860 [Acidobacteriota bacterium]
MKRVLVTVALMLLFLAVAATAQFTPWSAPVNLGSAVNSSATDCCLTVSKNGLSLFFRSTRSGFSRLYVSKRASVDAPWGAPQEIVGFNDGYWMACPALSPDEHRMFFQGSRPGGCGGGDLWVSRRHDRRDDFGWGPPVNLGCAPNGPNSPQGDFVPTVFEDETGTEVLYFGSGRLGLGNGDIWESRMRNDGTFGPATLVAELSSPSWEQVAVRRDGLEAILSSGRPGGPYPGTGDMWTSTRASTADAWSPPVPEPVLSSQYGGGGRMQISFDGREFYFCSNRPEGSGGNDLYVAKREKLRQ